MMLRSGISNPTFGCMRVSRFDRIHSMTWTGVFVTGLTVLWLLAIWLTFEPTGFKGLPIPLKPLPAEVGQPNESFDLTEVSASEFPESVSSDLSKILASVKMAVGDLSDQIGSPERPPRKPQPPSPPAKAIERWTIRYQTQNMQEYRNQLDALGIEIGVVKASSNDVFRVSNLSARPVARMTSRAAEDQTMYFAHISRSLKRWDLAIAAQAHVDLNNSIMVQFLDADTTEKLLRMEEAYATESGRKVDEIRRTNFVVVKSGNGFEFAISQMEFILPESP